MKKGMSKIVLLSVLAMALPLSGCVFDRSTPEQVLKSAYMALMQDDLRDFRATLSRDMKKQFRKINDMAKLKETLSNYEGLNVNPAELVNVEQRELRICNNMSAYPRYQTVESKQIHAVQVVGTLRSTTEVVPVLSAHVECAVSYNRVSQRGGQCYRKGPTFCSITELR